MAGMWIRIDLGGSRKLIFLCVHTTTASSTHGSNLTGCKLSVLRVFPSIEGYYVCNPSFGTAVIHLGTRWQISSPQTRKTASRPNFRTASDWRIVDLTRKRAVEPEASSKKVDIIFNLLPSVNLLVQSNVCMCLKTCSKKPLSIVVIIRGVCFH